MVGGLTHTDDDVVVGQSKTGFGGALSGRNGRMLVAGVALVLVLLAAGAVVYLFVFAGGSGDVTTPPPSSAGSASTTGSAESTVEVPVFRRARPLSSTFVFRDIFVPTLKPTPAAAAGGGTGGTGTGAGTGTGTGTGTGSGSGTGGTGGTTSTPTPQADTDTLVLQAVSTQGGVPVATFLWNGDTFVLAEGDDITGTPWRLVDIRGRTVVMLFGDTRITLAVGEGVITSGTSGSPSGGTTK